MLEPLRTLDEGVGFNLSCGKGYPYPDFHVSILRDGRRHRIKVEANIDVCQAHHGLCPMVNTREFIQEFPIHTFEGRVYGGHSYGDHSKGAQPAVYPIIERKLESTGHHIENMLVGLLIIGKTRFKLAGVHIVFRMHRCQAKSEINSKVADPQILLKRFIASAREARIASAASARATEGRGGPKNDDGQPGDQYSWY